ncbi:hypothetical protein ACX3O0_06990 [Homoserinimonas sp. A447]
MIQINITEQEAVDVLALMDSQILMGEVDRWTDSMLPSLRSVRDQLVNQGARDIPYLPGGLETP